MEGKMTGYYLFWISSLLIGYMVISLSILSGFHMLSDAQKNADPITITCEIAGKYQGRDK